MTTWEFPCPDPAAIHISSWASGSVAVSGEATDVISVEVVPSSPRSNVDDLLEQVRVTFENGRLAVKGPKKYGLRLRTGLDLTIKAPAGSDCQAHTAAADVSLVGQLGEVGLHTASGDVTVASAGGAATVQTASGDIFVDRADADVRISTASGDVQVGRARGELRINAVSGDLEMGDVAGQIDARTVSGDIAVRELSGGHAELGTTSGDMRIMVKPGLGVYLDLSSLSGKVRSELDESSVDDLDEGDGHQDATANVELRCRTVSGNVRISKALAAA
jgi:DUF4097 and DUF4098 domain-containing protein YvlB